MGSSREDLSSPWVAATQFGAVIFDLFGTLVPNFSMLELERVLYEMAALLSALLNTWSVCGWTPSHNARLGCFRRSE